MVVVVFGRDVEAVALIGVELGGVQDHSDLALGGEGSVKYVTSESKDKERELEELSIPLEQRTPSCSCLYSSCPWWSDP